MKKTMTAIISAFFAAACMLASGIPGTAAFAEGEKPVNLFESKGDWEHRSDAKGAIQFDGKELEITPIGIGGSTFCASKFSEGRLSFTYQLEYAEGVDPITPEDSEYQVFFGLLFGNNPEGVAPSGGMFCPYNVRGGYPYMVCFDTETQGGETTRLKQLGLTLRRYKAEGSHDYTRWSSVEPTNEMFINNASQPYESKIPDYYKPVTLADCYDTEKHTVDTDVKYLYKANGDEYDAVKIEVYFDGELSLRVIDEMPFEGNDFGEAIDVDKREDGGWISFFTYNGFNPNDLEFWDFKIHITSCSAVFSEGTAVNPKPVDSGSGSSSQGSASEKPGKGCGSAIGGGILGACAVAAVGFVLSKKKES